MADNFSVTRLDFERLSAWAIFRHDACRVVHHLASYLMRMQPFLFLGKRWFEWQLARSVLGSTEPQLKFFRFPVEYAERLLGADLQLNLPLNAQAMQHRLHDWVGADNKVLNVSSCFLCSGDWTSVVRSSKSGVMTEAVQLNKANGRYEDTQVFRQYMAMAQNGTPVIRNRVKLDSAKKIHDYFQRFLALFDSIRAHGVLPMASLDGTVGHQFGFSLSRKRRTEWGERDIGVAIGPNGELVLLPGGKHRLAVAAVLKISHVPVQVRMVHVEWLRQLPRQPGQTWLAALAEGLAAIRHQQASAMEHRGAA